MYANHTPKIKLPIFRHKIEKLKQGSEVYPWPKGKSPTEQWKRRALLIRGMHEWQDPTGHSTWIDIPQNETNEEDEEDDLPEEADGQIFQIARNQDDDTQSESSDED